MYFHRYISKSINCLTFIVRKESNIYMHSKVNFNTDNYFKLDKKDYRKKYINANKINENL